MRMQWLVLLAAVLGLSSCIPAVYAHSDPAPDSPPPNIVLIFVDDLGYGDLGVYGSTTIRTPQLDALAKKGVRLTEFYSASPVCTPARAALMTGRYPVRFGANLVFFPETFGGLPQSEITIAEILQQSGYETAIIGKWHLGHHSDYLPTEHGFDTFFGMPYSNDMRMPALMRDKAVVEARPDQSQLTQIYTQEAKKFIAKEREAPFFLYLAHTMPHVPIYPSKEFAGQSKGGIYGDVIEELDWSVGQIMAALKEQGLDKNTLVIFTSDNGPSLQMEKFGGSAGPLREGKATTFEGGMRVPAIFYWEGVIEPQSARDGVMTTLDLAPTLARIAGAQLPAAWQPDGEDLSQNLLTSEPIDPERVLFYYFRGKIEAVRKGRWKLKLAHKGHKVEWEELGWPGGYKPHGTLLYDLVEDPGEAHNLAAEKPGKVAELQQVIARFEAGLGPLPPTIEIRGYEDLSAQEYRDQNVQRLREARGVQSKNR